MFTVLGGKGFIGRHLVEYLRLLGHAVRVPERGDNLIEACKGSQVVYAIGLTADFRKRPFDTIEAHVSLASRILQQANFKSFLFLSSTRVYARATSTAEDATLSAIPQDPSDLYNLSKITGEAICLSSPSRSVRVARLSNVIGPEVATTDTFVGDLVREAMAGQIRLRTHPQSVKDYIWIDDAVRLLAAVAEKGQDRIYNIASGVQLRHLDWVDAIASATGCEVEIDQDAPMVSFPPITIKRIVEEFGFKAASPLERAPSILNYGRM